jgi:hypothetical protein
MRADDGSTRRGVWPQQLAAVGKDVYASSKCECDARWWRRSSVARGAVLSRVVSLRERLRVCLLPRTPARLTMTCQSFSWNWTGIVEDVVEGEAGTDQERETVGHRRRDRGEERGDAEDNRVYRWRPGMEGSAKRRSKVCVARWKRWREDGSVRVDYEAGRASVLGRDEVAV